MCVRLLLHHGLLHHGPGLIGPREREQEFVGSSVRQLVSFSVHQDVILSEAKDPRSHTGCAGGASPYRKKASVRGELRTSA